MGAPRGGHAFPPPPPPLNRPKAYNTPIVNIWLSNGAPLPYPGPTLPEMLGAPMVVGKGRSRGNSKGSGRYWEG